jgi:glucose repression mediator protein
MAMVPRQVSPPNGLHHYQQPGGHAQLNGHGPGQPIQKITPQTIATGNEAMWISIGTAQRS